MNKSKRLKFTYKTSHLQEPVTVSNYVSSHGTGWQTLCFGDISAERGRWRQGKRHHWSKFQARVWVGVCSHPPLPPSLHFKGQLHSYSADLPSAFTVAAHFWNHLQLLLRFSTFSNYTLPFEYNICFKYLGYADFFIYICLKKLWLCCVPWVIQ